MIIRDTSQRQRHQPVTECNVCRRPRRAHSPRGSIALLSSLFTRRCGVQTSGQLHTKRTAICYSTNSQSHSATARGCVQPLAPAFKSACDTAAFENVCDDGECARRHAICTRRCAGCRGNGERSTSAIAIVCSVNCYSALRYGEIESALFRPKV